MRVPLTALLATLMFAGCADPGITYRDIEPRPAGGPYGGDGTIDMVVAYFSFEIDAHMHGHMGAHCGFDGWSLEPATAKVHTNGDPEPDAIVMRHIHPNQSTERVGHFGTAPQAIWRHGHDVPRSFGDGDLGSVDFHGGTASFNDIMIPQDRWVLIDFSYTTDDQVKETLHLRHFPDAPVEFDRRELMCD